MSSVSYSKAKHLHTFKISIIRTFILLLFSCSFITRQSESQVRNAIIIPADAEILTDELKQRIENALITSDSFRLIEGNVYIGHISGCQAKPQDHLERSTINLGEAVNRYTTLDISADDNLSLRAFKHQETPFINISADPTITFTDSEQTILRKYLRDGGFAFIDNTTPESSGTQEELKKKLRDILGRNIEFKPVPNSHPIFHCYYDFDSGPPTGKTVHIDNTNNTNDEERYLYFHNDLEGIWLDNVMIAILSNNGYCFKWKRLSGNSPQLKFGVNLIVYSLLRENGILHKNNRIQSKQN